MSDYFTMSRTNPEVALCAMEILKACIDEKFVEPNGFEEYVKELASEISEYIQSNKIDSVFFLDNLSGSLPILIRLRLGKFKKNRTVMVDRINHHQIEVSKEIEDKQEEIFEDINRALEHFKLNLQPSKLSGKEAKHYYKILKPYFDTLSHNRLQKGFASILTTTLGSMKFVIGTEPIDLMLKRIAAIVQLRFSA